MYDTRELNSLMKYLLYIINNALQRFCKSKNCKIVRDISIRDVF